MDDARDTDRYADIWQRKRQDQDLLLHALNGQRTASANDGETLCEGDIILDGRYLITQLLYQRPRLNLYLGQRIISTCRGAKKSVAQSEDVVAIRELILTGLPPQIRAQVEAAAYEEFLSPVVLGSARLPTRGDRQYSTGERHYLIMQLHNSKQRKPVTVATLEELLLSRQEWPAWLDKAVALDWGTQLCRIVARLHRLGVVLGDLNPATVLVNREGNVSWAPVLLVSWPPAPQCWPSPAVGTRICAEMFPLAEFAEHEAFVAPELLNGKRDLRSDVYSLGAILYLLFTRYAPIAAASRLCAAQQAVGFSEAPVPVGQQAHSFAIDGDAIVGLELLAPSLLNDQLSASLEQVLLRALELDPDQRYPSVFALVEALEKVAPEACGVVRKEQKRERFWRRIRRKLGGTAE